jgi:hypothetical protein
VTGQSISELLAIPENRDLLVLMLTRKEKFSQWTALRNRFAGMVRKLWAFWGS